MYKDVSIEYIMQDLQAIGWELEENFTGEIVNKQRVIEGVFKLGDWTEVLYDTDIEGLWNQLADLLYFD